MFSIWLRTFKGELAEAAGSPETRHERGHQGSDGEGSLHTEEFKSKEKFVHSVLN